MKKNQENTLKERIKIITTNAINSSTFHGVSNIFNKPRILSKVFWLIIFVTSFSYCMYSITVNVMHFLEYPVILNICIKYVQPIQFPEMTICNLNSNLTIDKMLITEKCHFLNGPCNSSDFKAINVYDNTEDGHHKCYRFNENKRLRHDIYSASLHKVDIELFVGRNLHSVSRGLRIFLHTNDGYIQFDKGFDVSSGKFILIFNHYYLGVSISSVKKISRKKKAKEKVIFKGFSIRVYKKVITRCVKVAFRCDNGTQL